jgi:DnaJ-class molecular chaperone
MSTTHKLYTLLNLSQNASADDIKNAYKKLAVKFHPDRCKDAAKKKEFEEKFKEISHAYEILSNTDKRHIYDQVGDDENLDEIIRQNDSSSHEFSGFPGFARGGQIHFNPDITFAIRLSLEEIYAGKEISRPIKRVILTIKGQTPSQTYENDTVTIRVKPGTRSGEHIILHGQGNKIIADGRIQTGNVICVIEEIPHASFVRSTQQPLHLIYKHKISVFQALLGQFTFPVTGIDKNVFNVTIGKVVTNPETVICIENKGMRNDKGKYGNIYIMFIIEYPNDLTEEQRLALNCFVSSKASDGQNNLKISYTTVDKLQKIIDSPDPEEMHGNARMHAQQCPMQ